MTCHIYFGILHFLVYTLDGRSYLVPMLQRGNEKTYAAIKIKPFCAFCAFLFTPLNLFCLYLSGAANFCAQNCKLLLCLYEGCLYFPLFYGLQTEVLLNWVKVSVVVK